MVTRLSVDQHPEQDEFLGSDADPGSRFGSGWRQDHPFFTCHHLERGVGCGVDMSDSDLRVGVRGCSEVEGQETDFLQPA